MGVMSSIAPESKIQALQGSLCTTDCLVIEYFLLKIKFLLEFTTDVDQL